MKLKQQVAKMKFRQLSVLKCLNFSEALEFAHCRCIWWWVELSRSSLAKCDALHVLTHFSTNHHYNLTCATAALLSDQIRHGNLTWSHASMSLGHPIPCSWSVISPSLDHCQWSHSKYKNQLIIPYHQLHITDLDMRSLPHNCCSSSVSDQHAYPAEEHFCSCSTIYCNI